MSLEHNGPNWHAFTVRDTDSKGAAGSTQHMEILIDGKPLRGVVALEFKVSVDNPFPEIHLKMLGSIEIETAGNVVKKKVSRRNLKT